MAIMMIGKPWLFISIFYWEVIDVAVLIGFLASGSNRAFDGAFNCGAYLLFTEVLKKFLKKQKSPL